MLGYVDECRIMNHMKIYIARGKGIGTTELGAFDAALNDSGIANFNLIRLSSVIPPSTEVVEVDRIPEIDGEWGDRLYVVQAHYETSIVGGVAAAGVGWVIDETGKGLFVEHEGDSEEYVKTSIEKTLSDLVKTRQADFGKIYMMVETAECKKEGEPVAAMVTAMYKAESW